MIEDDVKAMLRARANDVHPSADGLERIEARLDAGERRSSRLPLLAAAAVVVVVGLVAALFAAQGDHDTPVTSTASTTTSTEATTTSTTVAIGDESSAGVWPGPGDADGIDPAVFHDPVATAQGYAHARVGRLDETNTRRSDYQAGDPNSGEVAFHGALETTVFVRQGHDGRWFVVGAASDLLPVHGDDTGGLHMTAEVDGMLRGVERSATGAEAPINPTRVARGAEVWHGTFGSAWRTITTESGVVGLAEAVVPTPPVPATAEVAIGRVGAADPRDAVTAYLEDAVGSDATVHVNDFTPGRDASHGEVTWQAGVVRVVKKDGKWFAQEAIGDSIQIAGTSLDVGHVSGSLTLAQAGTVHLTVGDTTWDVRNDVDREGTTVRFEHDISTTEPVILRAVFTTDTGYVSVAEKVIG
jgi:hypothetical protein